jgi:hypothetical protein
MKFEFQVNKAIVDNNGMVNVKASAIKQVVEETAEKAYGSGKAVGWVLGALFVGGTIIAIDAVTQFLSNDDDTASK